MKLMQRTLSTALLLAFLLAPLTAQAQVAVGISGGLSLASWSGDDIDDDDVDSRTGLLAGGFVNVPINDMFSFTSGLYYAQKGAEDAESGGDATFKLDYLEVPLLLQVSLGGSERAAFNVFAGPRLAFEMKCEIEGSEGGVSATIDCEDFSEFGGELETKSLTFGAIFGAGVRFMTSDTMFLLVNGGLDLGLTSWPDVDDVDIKNSAWFAQAGVGWVVGG